MKTMQVRFPDRVHERLKELAGDDGVSLNVRGPISRLARFAPHLRRICGATTLHQGSVPLHWLP